jgi:hypothetical protein
VYDFILGIGLDAPVHAFTGIELHCVKRIVCSWHLYATCWRPLRGKRIWARLCIDERTDQGTGTASHGETGQSRRQSDFAVDGVQCLDQARAGRQHKAGQEQEYGADRRDCCEPDGMRPRRGVRPRARQHLRFRGIYFRVTLISIRHIFKLKIRLQPFVPSHLCMERYPNTEH